MICPAGGKQEILCLVFAFPPCKLSLDDADHICYRFHRDIYHEDENEDKP